MHPGWLVLKDIGTLAPVLPVLGLLAVRVMGRESSDDARVLSGAMLLSLLADVYGRHHTGNDWFISYLYAPIQVIFWLLVAVKQPGLRVVMVALIVVLGGASAARGPLGSPETVVGVVGGGLAALCFTGTPWARAMWTYGGAAVPFLLCMAVIPRTEVTWLWSWGGYEAVRVLGLIALTAAIIREVTHGRGRDTGVFEGNRPVGRHSPLGGWPTAPTNALAALKKDIHRVAT